jgi:hypothetical protein
VLERKLHIIHRTSDVFVDIAITENGIPVASDGVVRCDITFERPGSASVTISSADNPAWFDLQFPTTVNGIDMNVVRVNLGNAPAVALSGRWDSRVTIFDTLGSFDCGVFKVEFAQLGDGAPGIGGGGGGGETRFALTDHSLLCEMTDEVVGPGPIDTPAGAVIFFLNTIGSPVRGTLRLYIGHTFSVPNGISTQLEVDGGSVIGSQVQFTVPAVSNTALGFGWTQFDIEGVMVEIAGEWATGIPDVPANGDFEMSVELISGFAPSVGSNFGILGTWADPALTNIGFRILSSAGVWVFRVQFRDPITLEVFAAGLFTIDLDTIFL